MVTLCLAGDFREHGTTNPAARGRNQRLLGDRKSPPEPTGADKIVPQNEAAQRAHVALISDNVGVGD